MSSQPQATTPPDIYATLAQLNISFVRHDHDAVFTCDEAVRAVPDHGGFAHTKNLFLRDKKGRRHWLVVTLCSKPVDLRALAATLGADNLSLASPERLAEHLGITPGAVTALALIADTRHAVELVVDADAWKYDSLCCHPLVNTSTLVLSRTDLQRFFDFTGHAPRVVRVPVRA